MQVITPVKAPARTEPLNAAQPSRLLFDPKNPMPWVPSAATDVTKTWERARAAQKGGAA